MNDVADAAEFDDENAHNRVFGLRSLAFDKDLSSKAKELTKVAIYSLLTLPIISDDE